MLSQIWRALFDLHQAFGQQATLSTLATFESGMKTRATAFQKAVNEMEKIVARAIQETTRRQVLAAKKAEADKKVEAELQRKEDEVP